MNHKLTRLTILIIFATLAACNLPTAQTNIPAEIAPALPTPLAVVDANPPSLPAAVYYLSNESGVYQVWRLAPDRSTTSQITFSETDVNEYSVATATGSLAYVASNRLYLQDAAGNQLPQPESERGTPTDDNFLFTDALTGVAWSNDGNTLAYGLNGIHIYQPATQTDQLFIENEFADEFGTPKAIYAPQEFSPNDALLLVTVSFDEGAGLATINLSSSETIPFEFESICCRPIWANDSQSVIVASPFLGFFESGLWRYEVSTGVRSDLLATVREDQTYNFADWPYLNSNGILQYFYNNAPDIPEGNPALTLVNNPLNQFDAIEILRPETWIPEEVLWFPDGSAFLMIETPYGVPTWPRTGPVLLADITQSLPLPIISNAYNLQWGP